MFQSIRRTVGGTKLAVEKDHGQAPDEFKKVANNTFWYRIGDREFWRLHETDIVIHDLKEKVWTLSTGGWQTPTTKDRISAYAPVQVGQEKGVWYCYIKGESYETRHKKRYPFADGMRIKEDGRPENEGLLKAKEAEQKKLLKAILKFSHKVKKVILEKGMIQPGAGDCFYCSMETQEGKTMGDLSGSDHLLSHIKEGYVHGSLIFRAMQAKGYGNLQVVWQMAASDPKGWANNIAADVRKYLKRALKVG